MATKKKLQNVCTHITSKRIVPVGRVLSGFEFFTKPDQPGLFSSIRLEVMCILCITNTAPDSCLVTDKKTAYMTGPEFFFYPL